MSQASRHLRIEQTADLALIEIKHMALSAMEYINRSFGQRIRQHRERMALEQENMGDA